MPRTAAKIDANQKEIGQCLREESASVFSISGVGKGCPDLLVGIDGVTYLVEVKDGDKPPSAQSLTRDQLKFIMNWNGSSVVILRDVSTARSWVRTKRLRQEATTNILRGGQLDDEK